MLGEGCLGQLGLWRLSRGLEKRRVAGDGSVTAGDREGLGEDGDKWVQWLKVGWKQGPTSNDEG